MGLHRCVHAAPTKPATGVEYLQPDVIYICCVLIYVRLSRARKSIGGSTANIFRRGVLSRGGRKPPGKAADVLRPHGPPRVGRRLLRHCRIAMQLCGHFPDTSWLSQVSIDESGSSVFCRVCASSMDLVLTLVLCNPLANAGLCERVLGLQSSSVVLTRWSHRAASLRPWEHTSGGASATMWCEGKCRLTWKPFLTSTSGELFLDM